MIKITIVEGAFGTNDTPPCERCGALIKLVGRETHPELGAAFELQTFECNSCGKLSTRSVDERGKAPAA